MKNHIYTSGVKNFISQLFDIYVELTEKQVHKKGLNS